MCPLVGGDQETVALLINLGAPLLKHSVGAALGEFRWTISVSLHDSLSTKGCAHFSSPTHTYFFFGPPYSFCLHMITSVLYVSADSVNTTTIMLQLRVADCFSYVIFTWNEVSPPSDSIFCYLYLDVWQPRMNWHWNFQFRQTSHGSDKKADLFWLSQFAFFFMLERCQSSNAYFRMLTIYVWMRL